MHTAATDSLWHIHAAECLIGAMPNLGFPMNDDLFEQLLHEGESSSLDYKRDQYPFAGASDEDKSELLKDILALANGWRHADANILIGVDEVIGGRSTVVGVSDHIADNDLQQFVNSKTNRSITFSYRAYPYEGKQIGIITIPKQERPFYVAKDYGKVHKHVVYYRQGTSTAIATPDDIARMGTPVEMKKLLEGYREAAKKEEVRVTLGIGTEEGLFVDVFNSGEVPVYIKEVALCKQAPQESLVKLPLLAAVPMTVTDGKGSIAYVVPGTKNHDLPARKEVRYVLPRFPAAMLRQLSSGAPENVWLSVFSYGGEVHRVSSGEVHPALLDLVKLLELLEEQAKPKILNVVFYTHGDGGIKKEVGALKAHLARPGGKGPVQVSLEPVPGFAISKEEGERLAQDLVNQMAIGKCGKYEWRVE